MAAFQKAVAADAKLAEAFYYLGETQTRLNNNAGALTSYEKATQLKADYFDAWLGLGSAYYVAERYPESVEAYKRAVKLKNDNAEAFDNLGDAYRQAGNFNDAEANYNLAALFIQKKPDYSKQDLADVYSKIGYVVGKQCEVNVRRQPPLPCRWNVAITSLEKAAALGDSNLDNANLGWAYYNSARIDMANRRLPEAQAKLQNAKANLQKAILLNPKFVDAPTLNLGVVLLDLGEFAEAAKTLEKVADKHPEWNFGNYALGTAYYKSNNFNGAEKYFRKAVNSDDRYVNAWASLGYTELKLGNRKEVEKIISKLQKLNVNEANKLQSQLLATTTNK